MRRVSIRFYGELNDLLPGHHRQTRFSYPLEQNQSLKDFVEARGVPHTEVDLVLVSGRSVTWDYWLQGGDRISVYPPFRSLDISAVTQVRPAPLDEPRFVLDGHLGKLATYLRLLGFDTLYRNDYEDSELARISYEQRRILLTRDRGLLKRNSVQHGYIVRNIVPAKQTIEVLQRYDLFDAIAPWQRCLRCNGLLEPVDKAEILHLLEPETRVYYNEFVRCAGCERIYWRGSHYDRLQRLIDELLKRRR